MSKLKDAIMADGRKQYLIAGLAGINETLLSKFAIGRRIPTEVQKKALAKVLRKSVRELFGEG